MRSLISVPRGLAGVAVTDTALSDVRGDEGFFHYRQYDATELARRRSFDDVMALFLDGALPAPGTATDTSPLAVPAAVIAALPAVARLGTPVEGLRTALSMLAAAIGARPLFDQTPTERSATAWTFARTVPSLVVALAAAREGRSVPAPTPGSSTAEVVLHGLRAATGGPTPTPAEVRALDQYLVLVADHGFNASTFTARVVASTGADLGAVLVAALGALTGPLHGGAPSRVLDLLDAVGPADRAATFVDAELAAGRRLMGFGHAMYRTDDPRSTTLRAVAEHLGGRRVEVAEAVEAVALDRLAAQHPERPLRTNVEFYAAVVLEACGVPREWFTPVFGLARTVGWCANALEQAADGKIIRPDARYVGPPAPVTVPA